MFELIDDPKLKELQQKVASLERARNEAEAKAGQLRVAVRDARGEDITAEAVALNAGKKPPKPKEPALREKLEAAERELEVLARRHALAGAEVSKFVQAHHAELAALVTAAERREAAKVSKTARQLLSDLGRYYQLAEDRKAMRPMLPVEESDAPPARLTQIMMGSFGTQNVGAPQRGEIEGVLAHLASLGDETEEAQGAA